MAKVYANLICKGLKAIDDVPASLRPEVEGLLGVQTDADRGDML